MQRLIWTILAAFLMAIAFGPVVIPWLKKMKFGQTIYELGPETHKKKQGVPTMGGIIFALPALVAAFAFAYADSRWDFLLICAICAVGFGIVGFLDDWIKVTRKRSLGLTARQKLVPQILLSVALAYWAYQSPDIGSALRVPFTDIEWQLGYWYIPVMTFILVGTVNSANLLDGVDGLLGGCALFDFATMALICVSLASASDGSTNLLNTAIFSGAMAGALLGYLRFNSYPAGVIMGDVGSFFIGGGLVGVILVTRYALLLPIIALAMMVSSLSVIIQTTYFKLTGGKRVFRMSPLHHHFELSGMPETRIVTMYYTVTVLLCLVALTGFVG
jgi:phospho-N-acetylmuramoyl-pentapeptide-transferase